MTSVTINGHTYTDDSDPTTGMGNGGHRTRFIPCVSDVVVVAGQVVTNATTATTQAGIATTQAAASAASAATALAAPGTNATSTTSLSISAVSKTLTIQTGKSFVVGMTVKIASTASPTKWMAGDITAYNSGTGSLTVKVVLVNDTGTLADWTVSITAPVSTTFVTGVGGYSARTSNTVIGVNDKGILIDITAGTFAQTIGSAASLGGMWVGYIRNSGTGVVTLTPNGADLLDGLNSTITMYRGEERKIICDGTSLYTEILSPFCVTFTTSGNFVKPRGYTKFGRAQAGGGGAGGHGSTNGLARTGASGGGAGAYYEGIIDASSLASTETVTVGAGGIATNGGNTTFAVITTYGGGVGNNAGAAVAAGSGGGLLTAAVGATAGTGTLTGYDNGITQATSATTIYGGNSGSVGGSVAGTNATVVASYTRLGGWGGGGAGGWNGVSVTGQPTAGGSPTGVGAGLAGVSGVTATSGTNATGILCGGGGGGNSTGAFPGGNGGWGFMGGGGGASGNGSTFGTAGRGGDGFVTIWGIV